ncbi:nucleoside hydrolase [Allonocardiopsis opalescens]|uniref:Purine nucleosidase n=1 Tax=Allonocardiopsis opalescens TaxID=1144618 RepID=A0A2T0Q485_9ACTN|nr:nucleoside hydrolase [Allonocardiopsis opalescens]PRX98602.1 purine nucleosidase [Allonocardiopsis opalescens]
MPTRLVIDTDTAADDCFALLAGALHPAADLIAVTLVAGNVGFARQVENALITLDAAGRPEVPVHAGAERPLLREWVSAENVHGDGRGGHAFAVPERAVEAEHAVDALVRIAREHPGEVDVVAIGPLTNIALAARRDPAFPRNVRSLYVMGGSNNGRGNITAAAEYNFYVDPEAARIVFSAGFDTTVVTWNLTLDQALFDTARLAAISALDTPLSRFFDLVNAPTLAFDRSVGIDGSTHPDSLTVALLLEPGLVRRSRRYFVDVETQGELTRGYAVFDWGVFGKEPNATVVEEIDAAGFHRFMLDLLARRP